MDETALAEWKGGINEFRDGVNRRFRSVEAKAKDQDKEIDRLDRELTKVTTKIGIAAGIGAIAGGAIATFILTFATKAIGG